MTPILCENDTEMREGRIFNEFVTANNFEVLIHKPAHIQNDVSQSSIDLIYLDYYPPLV